MQLPEPTLPIDVTMKGNHIQYYLKRGKTEYIENGDTLTFVGDNYTAQNVRELQRGSTYRFVSTDPDNVILEHMKTHERVLLFKETFSLALRNGYFTIN